MRHSLAVAALLALVLSGVSARAATIEGKVIRKDTGRPESGCQIEIIDLKKVAHSDTLGRFEFLDIPPGPHSFFVQGQKMDAWRKVIEVLASDTTRIGVELTPLTAPGVLTGRVTAGAGAKAVPHAHVQLPPYPYDIQADDTGAYWMYGVPPGNYHAKASALGYDPVYAWVKVESGPTSIVSFDLGQAISLTKKASAVPAAVTASAAGDSLSAVRFTIPTDSLPPDPRDLARKRPVKIEIQDAASKSVVATIVEQELFPGDYVAFWDGSDGHARKLPAGSYRYAVRIEKHPAMEGDIVLR